jgi:hypothetical protein
MARTFSTTNEHAHPKMTALIGIAAKDADPTTMIDTTGPVK